MIEYRHARPEEYSEYCAFADYVFNDRGTDICFADALPKVYAKDANCAELQHIAFDTNNGIRGLVAVLPNDLFLGKDKLSTGFIGTVSVHPNARGEGHMKRLMAMCLDEMRAENMDIALLGGQRQRYEYFGFVPGGIMFHHFVRSANIRHALRDVDASGVRFEEMCDGCAFEKQAAQLHESRTERYSRERFVVNCKSYHHHPFAVLNESGFAGFLVADRTLVSIADICLTENADIDKVLKAWMAYIEKDALSIELPAYERTLNRHLRTWVERTQLRSAVSARILNYPKAVGALLRAKARYTRLTDGTVTFDCESQRFTVCVKDNAVVVLEGGEDPISMDVLTAGRLFLDPFECEDVPELPVNWFPLPLFVTEPDSF